ncbi:hypothetical protein I4U23_005431 [Adineta vaga]|nr:hypothetical protein I4U23_005431 [Adineta vaga]
MHKMWRTRCFICSYDFEATNDKQLVEYRRLSVDNVVLSIWSPTTPMHILHDCFRSLSAISEMTLKLAIGIFSESVAWLKRLIKDTIPSVLMTDDGHRVYKFAAGIDRTPIWYHKKESWFWPPDWPLIEWIQCPRLNALFEPWIGQASREDNIILMADKLFSVEKENLEDLTVIWLDENSQDINTKTRLRCIINFLKIFTELNLCLKYIQSIPNENIFIIVSGQLIFATQELLYDQLSKDANQFYATHSTLFITALLDMPPSDEAKQDLLKVARTFYADNDRELRRIDDFDQRYKASEALNWYSSDSFAYRLLNKAIRTENIDLLFACRFFIVDLHRQLHSLDSPYMELIRSCGLDIYTVYHGQLMTLDDFTKLQANVGKLISINSFLSTSIDSKVALVYAGDKTAHANMESVLFQITINVTETSHAYQHPFADISAYSHFQEEQEVLFSLAAMFRIEDISERT